MSLDKLIRDVLKDANSWDRRYGSLTLHALHNFHTEEEAEGLFEEFLSKDSQWSFNLANPFSKELLLSELLPSLLGHLAGNTNSPSGDIQVSCAMGTFLRPEWNFPEGNIEFDIGKAKKTVRNALAGFDFLGKFEAVAYQNEFMKTAQGDKPLVCFHAHVLIWTTYSYSKLERLRKSLQGRFRGTLIEKDGPHFSQVSTPKAAAKELAYIAKMPALGKRTETTLGGSVIQSSRTISYRAYNAMFNELRKHDLYTFWLSGGDGAKLLRDARARLRQQQPQARISTGFLRQTPKHRRRPRYHRP